MKPLKFIPVKQPRLALRDVKDGQFFTNINNCLCQKIDGTSYVIIANADGSLYGRVVTLLAPETTINSIRNEIGSIEF